MRIAKKVLESVESITFVLVACAIAISMVAGTADVIAIRFFNRSLRGSVEFSTILMPIIVYVSLAYIQRVNRHVRVEFFYARARPRTQAFMDVLNGVLVITACIFLTWISWRGAVRSYDIREAAQAFPLPIWPVKMLITFGFVLMILRMLVDTGTALLRLRDPEAAPPPETVAMPMQPDQ
jgi:TRAP-type C4-dicarboxylate transport system permease small subunit